MERTAGCSEFRAGSLTSDPPRNRASGVGPTLPAAHAPSARASPAAGGYSSLWWVWAFSRPVGPVPHVDACHGRRAGCHRLSVRLAAPLDFSRAAVPRRLVRRGARLEGNRRDMNPATQKLSSLQRWALYLVLTGLPGLTVSVLFGFGWALLFELVAWIPQQRLFDLLELAKTLPFQEHQ